MIKFLADENFDHGIVRGLRRRLPALDVAFAQDVGLSKADDPAVLAWAAHAGRVVMTHDVQTFAGFAYDRVRNGLPMSGVVEVPRRLPIGKAIDDLELLATATEPSEWEGQVQFLPL